MQSILYNNNRRGIDIQDEEIMSLLDDVGIMNQIVVTKIDTIPSSEYDKLFNNIIKSCNKHVSSAPWINVTSSQVNFGIQEMKYSIVQSLINKL